MISKLPWPLLPDVTLFPVQEEVVYNTPLVLYIMFLIFALIFVNIVFWGAIRETNTRIGRIYDERSEGHAAWALFAVPFLLYLDKKEENESIRRNTRADNLYNNLI